MQREASRKNATELESNWTSRREYGKAAGMNLLVGPPGET